MYLRLLGVSFLWNLVLVHSLIYKNEKNNKIKTVLSDINILRIYIWILKLKILHFVDFKRETFLRQCALTLFKSLWYPLLGVISLKCIRFLNLWPPPLKKKTYNFVQDSSSACPVKLL